MRSSSLLPWLEQAAGLALVGLVLLDVYLTVLYVRAGAGLISDKVARATWRCFLALSAPMGARRGHVLSFCGPSVLVVLVLTWALLLASGVALVIQPALGSAVRATSGPTSTDFFTAMYAGASSLTIVGATDFTPHTPPFRLLFLFTSVIGLTVTWLTLTYLMQVYNALERRNTLALRVHLLTNATGDAAELVARLGPEGQFAGGYTELSQIGAEIAAAKETHHFYPVLVYFRFDEAFYSVSRITAVALDAATLIATALDDSRFGWLKASAGVRQLWLAPLVLDQMLSRTFLPSGVLPPEGPPDSRMVERSRHRYFAALRRLREAGVPTTPDEEGGARAYVALRVQWERYVVALAPFLAYDIAEIDSAGGHAAADPATPVGAKGAGQSSQAR